MSEIELRSLSRSFGSVRAVDGVDLVVAHAESLVVLGPSGSGKSTLLRLIAGLETPDGGEVRIAGRDQRGLAPHRRDVGIVFQHYALYPHLPALANITLGLRKGLGLSKAEALARAHDVAARLEITELLDRLPRQLSGGQRQRVALARALARRAGTVLLDEPLSDLDAQLRLALRVEIAGVLRATGATTVHVTHDQLDAMAMADRIAVMRSGRIEQLGTPDELYQQPATEFVAGFIGSPPMNLLPAARTGGEYATVFGRFAAIEHERVALGVRPEKLTLTAEACERRTGAAKPLSFPALVQVVEPAGPSDVVHARAAAVTDLPPIAIRCDPARRPAVGDRVRLECHGRDLHVFGGERGVYLGTAEELLRQLPDSEDDRSLAGTS